MYDIYLFVEGIDDDKPLAVFNSSNPQLIQPINVSFIRPIELSEIFIKFKTSSDPQSDKMVDFNEQPHELLFRVGTQ